MAPTFTKVNAIIVDPDLPSRMRLRQATASVVQFGEVALLGGVTEALQRLAEKSHFDLVFISYRVSETDLKEFISRAKASPHGRDMAFISVLKTQAQQNAAVAQHMLVGVDGFLFEPYSVDLLLEITALATRLKKERTEIRERAAITLLVSEIMTQLDLVAFLKSQKLEVTRSSHRLHEMAAKIKDLSDLGKQQYVEIAINRFIDAPPPRLTQQARNYSGASSRVRKLLGQKLEAEVEKNQETERARIESGK